jgi:F-type H+-transporting ATPase subunit epsilon
VADKFQFKLITPTGVVFDGPVEQATAVGPLGEFSVRALHTDFITSIVPGMLTIKTADADQVEFLLHGGLAEVKDGTMTVLAVEATPPESVDSAAAVSDVQVAERELAELSFYDSRYGEAEHALRLARARSQISQLRRAHH